MKNGQLLAGAALMALLATPLAAAKAADITVYTDTPTQLRAGPDDDFPVVAEITSGANVNVNGCVNGFTWCDVEYRGNHGWVNARDLENDRHVNVVEYGPRAKVPTVVFEQRSYWDNYYHDRPFYTEQRYWHTETTR